MNTLAILTLNFQAQAQRDILLPGYLGNTIRGALGTTLSRTHCRKNTLACNSCDFSADCVYRQVFKMPDMLPGFSSVPNPFVIKAPKDNKRRYTTGEMMGFSIVLFGRAIGWWREIAEAMENSFKGRFGGHMNAFKLTDIYDDDNNNIFCNGHFGDTPQISVWSDETDETLPDVSAVGITFMTPTEIRHKDTLVIEPGFNLFINNLINRISLIIDIYGDKDFTITYRLLGRKPYVSSNFATILTSIDQEKFYIEGIIGKLTFEGELSDYLPYLALGTKLHIGKKTTRGCGEYELDLLF